LNKKRSYNNITKMGNNDIINKTVDYVKTELAGNEGGHDWWHVYRVWQTAKKIAKEEKVDMLVVELGALLHDIADSKFYQGNEEIGPKKAEEFLKSAGVDDEINKHIIQIIRNISFKGGNRKQKFRSPELDVIQDADRLDAIGAIGIARTFNYGGFIHRPIFDPGVQPNLNMTAEEYKNSTAPTLNHFYEKLLLLKDRMNTPTGRKMAAKRHTFMEQFLEEFYNEWEGKS
jgi:uncharacterized protein